MVRSIKRLASELSKIRDLLTYLDHENALAHHNLVSNVFNSPDIYTYYESSSDYGCLPPQ